MSLIYEGRVYKIVQTEDAEVSQPEAEAHARKACIAQLDAMIKRLANMGKLNSPKQINNEGNGIWAIKARCGLRAYGWYCRCERGVFVISHYIYKKQQRLDPRDMARAEGNRSSYENGALR
jgi:hypothetical protein